MYLTIPKYLFINHDDQKYFRLLTLINDYKFNITRDGIINGILNRYKKNHILVFIKSSLSISYFDRCLPIIISTKTNCHV